MWTLGWWSFGLVMIMLAGACGRSDMPRTGPEFLARGEQRLRANDRNGALADFTRAAELGRIEAIGQRAEVLFELRRFDEVQEDLERMIAARPNDPKWYLLRARTFLEQGRSGQAVHAAGRAVRLDPNSGFGYLIRARAWEAQGRLDAALSDVDQALQVSPDPATRVRRGDLRLETGDLAGARADYLEARDGGAAGGWRGLAKVHIAEGDFSAAVEAAERAARLDPSTPENHAVHARALELSGRQAAARQAWDRGAESAPDAVCIRAGRAPFALVTGDAHVAREDLNTLLQARQRVPEALLWLLLVDLEQGATRDEGVRNARAFLERVGADSRLAPIFRFLAGEIDVPALLQATPAGWHDPEAYRSLATFFAGYQAMKLGDSETARARFEATVACRQRLSDEFWAARFLLERLSAR